MINVTIKDRVIGSRPLEELQVGIKIIDFQGGKTSIRNKDDLTEDYVFQVDEVQYEFVELDIKQPKSQLGNIQKNKKKTYEVAKMTLNTSILL